MLHARNIYYTQIHYTREDSSHIYIYTTYTPTYIHYYYYTHPLLIYTYTHILPYAHIVMVNFMFLF